VHHLQHHLTFWLHHSSIHCTALILRAGRRVGGLEPRDVQQAQGRAVAADAREENLAARIDGAEFSIL
jgi:hypothetical protein